MLHFSGSSDYGTVIEAPILHIFSNEVKKKWGHRDCFEQREKLEEYGIPKMFKSQVHIFLNEVKKKWGHRDLNPGPPDIAIWSNHRTEVLITQIYESGAITRLNYVPIAFA